MRQPAIRRSLAIVRATGADTDTTARALAQAARELMLAQSSDWPFILRTGTSPAYARKRVTDHILRFISIYELVIKGQMDESCSARWRRWTTCFPT